jgi:glycosyltransferase involved in cell wall biosynthesis
MNPQPEVGKTLEWLIVEDSLEDRKGHWFEYMKCFFRELPSLGDRVTWLVSRNAMSEVLSTFGAFPILPESAFRKVSDSASAWKRYLRIPLHAWKTFFALKRFLGRNKTFDIIFLPTVIVHHLLGWFFLVKTILRRSKSKILLFFPNLPIRLKGGTPTLDGSPTARLTSVLLKGLASEVGAGRVILGVETLAMKRAAEEVFGVPFTYFPHPVHALDFTSLTDDSANLRFGCYGASRFEKGSDLLVSAIDEYLQRFPESRVRFIFQWIDNFSAHDGRIVKIPEFLREHPKVEIISRLFAEGEYDQWLRKTDLLLLPYRSSSYDLRVSRVVIEAMVIGIPTVVTAGTTMAQQVVDFGSGLTCENEDVESIVSAIVEAVSRLSPLTEIAKERQHGACEHFSVNQFRKSLHPFL